MTHRRIVPFDISRLVKLSQDIFRQHFPKLHSHLIYPATVNISLRRRRENLTVGIDSPDSTLDENLVFVQRNKSTFTQSEIKIGQDKKKETALPSTAGVNNGNMILLLGRFPSNTLLFTNASPAPLPTSARTCSSVLPNARASGCAKKLLSRIR